jgi:hypothetical protein
VTQFQKRDVTDEARDDHGRWVAGGASAVTAMHNFFGKLGSSVLAGWNNLSSAEKTATIVAIGGAVAFTAEHGANHLPPQVHAHLTDALRRAGAYAASGDAARHAAAAAGLFRVAGKLMQQEFPGAGETLKGLGKVFGVAAVSAGIPKVGRFLSDIAIKLASHPIAKSYKRPTGKTLVSIGGPIVDRRGYKVRGNAGALQPFLPKSPFLRT